LSVAVSLVPMLVSPTGVNGQTSSDAVAVSKWVRPVKDNVVVYTSTGTKVERIGVLNKDVVVEVLREDQDWYQVRFVRENAEFVGWVLQAEVAVEGTPPEPPKRTPKPDAAPQPKEEKTQEKQLTIQETHDKLLEMVEIPVSTSPVFKRSWDRSKMNRYQEDTGSTGTVWGGGQKAKMDVLYLFDPDEVVQVYVEDKIRELKKLRKEGDPNFVLVIDCYIRALEAYSEGKYPDLRRLVNQAEGFWKRIAERVSGIDVGF
jgi:hypothetical protein